MSDKDIQGAWKLLRNCDHGSQMNRAIEDIYSAYLQKCAEFTMVKKIASELYDAVNTSEGRLEAMKHYEELKAREE